MGIYKKEHIIVKRDIMYIGDIMRRKSIYIQNSQTKKIIYKINNIMKNLQMIEVNTKGITYSDRMKTTLVVVKE